NPARIGPTERARFGDIFCADLASFMAARPHWVVEAAGHVALRQWGPAVLRGGANLMPLSASALVDDAFRDELRESAVAAGRRVLIPSGGMGALDILGSAALDRLDSVQLTTRKPP